MGAREHEHQARRRAVPTVIIIASTTRDASTDRTGPWLEERCGESGFEVVARSIVDDAVGALQGALHAALDAGAGLVLISGGTGVSPRDVTPEAIEPLYERTLPGFGERLRAASFEEVGAAGLLSRASAGVVGGALVFLLPGSLGACKTAMPIIESLARHALHLLQPEQQAPITTGWKAVLAERRMSLDRDRAVAMPSAIARTTILQTIVQRAGDQCAVIVEGEDPGVLLGWPDLIHDEARVLFVRGGRPFGEVTALHLPAHGLVPREGSWLGAPVDLELVSTRWTGRPYPAEGDLFAVEGDRVYVIEAGRISSWDGETLREEGDPEEVAGRLVRGWTAQTL
jgi:molybdenum cofactor biosynthesis protein B